MYRRRFYRRRRTFGRRRRGRRSYFRRTATSRRYTAPEIKHVEFPNAPVTVLSTANWSTAPISPVSLTQGISATTVLGQQVRSRFLIINMTMSGALTTDTNRGAQDGLIRFVFFTPIQDATHVQAHIVGQSDFNYHFDYREIAVLKDFKVVLGRQDSTNGSQYSRMIKLKFPWPRNMKLRDTSSSGVMNIDEQKDILYVAVKSNFNDAHWYSVTRMTFTDS